MDVPLRLLLVEDSPDDAELVIRKLSRDGYEPSAARVETEEEFVCALEENKWDIVIADYVLPKFSGPAALEILKKKTLDIPFIIISGTVGEDVAVEMMRAGASDYMMKDSLTRLTLTVKRELREAESRKKRREAEEMIRRHEDRLKKGHIALASLARSHTVQSGDFEDALKEILETTGKIMGTSRVGYWRYNEDKTKLVCHNVYEFEKKQHSGGFEITVSDCPKYFKALDEERFISAQDAYGDYRTVEFIEIYLEPFGIKSILDAAIRLRGELVGVVCLEHVSTLRHWTSEDEVFAGSIADLISLALGANERKRTEEALRKSEERYRELYENANDIIYTTNLAGEITSINKKGEELSGFTHDEIVGVPVTEWISADSLESIFEKIQAIRKGRVREESFEVEVIGNGGRKIPLEVNSRWIYEDGKPVGTQGIARDISERKHFEEQLVQSQKMEAVGKLAGGVAHDFNNLLTAIMGYVQLAMKKNGDNGLIKKDLQEIEKAGQRAASLTSQLLTFSRRAVLKPEVLNLNEVVINIEQMLRRLIGEQIELITHFHPSPEQIRVDRGQIEVALMNLVVNSRDAMPKGGSLTIETSKAEINTPLDIVQPDMKFGNYAVLRVRDTGIGIDKEVQQHIFDPFFTTKEKGKGTGLGLSTVYGIVKQSEGYINVESEVGKGSVFEIFLPTIESQVKSLKPVSNITPVSNGTETILLVEDDAGVRRLARLSLKLNGYTVIEAEDADTALSLCLDYKDKIDLLVTDVILPGENGRELAAKLTKKRSDLKVLYISGYTDDTVALQEIYEARTPFLAKPFTPETLCRKVRDLLDLSSNKGDGIWRKGV